MSLKPFIPANISRNNNFDLLRLYAAIEVMFFHIFPNMGIDVDSIRFPQKYFNGVTIFYFISGFLITQSYLRSSSIKQYFTNRILRLTPALICVWLLTIIIIMVFGKFGSHLFFNGHFWLWSLLHCTVWPGYNTCLFPDFANNGVNGALWTISTEITFYILIPIIFLLFRRKSIYALVVLFCFSVITNHFWLKILPSSNISGIRQWYWLTLGPYLWNFLVGTFICLYWDKLKPIIQGKFLYWLLLYLFIVFVLGYYPDHKIRHFSTLVINVILGFLVFSAAFSFPKAHNVLHKKDISYGVYVYHCVIQNTFIELGLTGYFIYPMAVFIISIIIGFISWQYIESRALMLKNTFYPLKGSATDLNLKMHT